MNGRLLVGLGMLGALALAATPAQALPGAGAKRLEETLARGATAMTESGFIASYTGFRIFCETYPDQCETDGKAAVVALDETKARDLVEVNSEVNGRIVPDRYGRDFDHWNLYSSFGHCNEYAIQKRKALIDRGWPAGSLALSVVHTRYDEGNILHLVLSVRTDKGDLVLDNLRSSIVPWNRTGYGFVMRQSTVHPKLWVRVVRPDEVRAMERIAAAKKVEPKPAVKAPVQAPIEAKPVEETPVVAVAAPAVEPATIEPDTDMTTVSSVPETAREKAAPVGASDAATPPTATVSEPANRSAPGA